MKMGSGSTSWCSTSSTAAAIGVCKSDILFNFNFNLNGGSSTTTTTTKTRTRTRTRTTLPIIINKSHVCYSRLVPNLPVSPNYGTNTTASSKFLINNINNSNSSFSCGDPPTNSNSNTVAVDDDTLQPPVLSWSVYFSSLSLSLFSPQTTNVDDNCLSKACGNGGVIQFATNAVEILALLFFSSMASELTGFFHLSSSFPSLFLPFHLKSHFVISS